MNTRDNLKAQATELGIDFPQNIPTDKLEALVEEHLSKEEHIETKEEMEIRLKEELQQRYDEQLDLALTQLKENTNSKKLNNMLMGKHKKEIMARAHRLIRVNVSSNDPMKSNWEGEFITGGNDAIGDITKYVKYNTDEGWHLPQIIVDILRNKKCTIFVTKRSTNSSAAGKTIKEAKQVPAYSIVELDPLTPDELLALRQKQRAEQLQEEY